MKYHQQYNFIILFVWCQAKRRKSFWRAELFLQGFVCWECSERLQTKIDLSRENLYGSYRVVQIQWHDDVQNRYLTYDFPVSYKGNAEILEQLVTAEKQRLTTSLFGEIRKMNQYGEVKTVDKTERGAGER